MSPGLFGRSCTVLLLCVLTSARVVNAASGPVIGAFADADGTDCNIQHMTPGVGMFYVFCDLAGEAADGIQAVEFAITGLPADWIANVISSPASNMMFWNPVQGGSTVVFPECQTGDGGRVFVCTVVYYMPRRPILNGVLSVTKNKHRIDPSYQCPLVKVCRDLPAELRVCAASVDAAFNGLGCPVGVDQTTWSSWKALFDPERPILTKHE